MIEFSRSETDGIAEGQMVKEIECREENRGKNETHRFLLPSAKVIRRRMVDGEPLWEKRFGVRKWGELNVQDCWESRFQNALENENQ